MILTRREIERIAADRVYLSYKKRMVKLMIIYTFGLLVVCFPVSLYTSIGIWIFFLGLVLMLFFYVVVSYYKILPKARKMAQKMFDEMLQEENDRPESGRLATGSHASIDGVK